MTADVAIIGGGPAGLAAAELLSAAGHGVTVYEAMPTPGRKFLLAGKSGLNLTHAEDHARFATRFGAANERLRAALDAFPPEHVRAWADGLGAQTFAGSSGRVFPRAMKASPLLRAWIARLEAQGVKIRTRHRWTCFVDGRPVLETPGGRVEIAADATLLALGGASWPRLGSDGSWIDILRAAGVAAEDLRPANCGFERTWSDHFRERFAGAPVKSVAASSAGARSQGEFVVADYGIEGSLVYAHAAALRDDLIRHGQATLCLDLAPGRTVERLAADLARQPVKASLSTRLRKGAGLDEVKAALVRELLPEAAQMQPPALAGMVKALPLGVARPRPIAEAISSAGGIAWAAIDDDYMLRALPGVFVAGEMIDWEAPTGGYLLTACLATGRAAAAGIAARLAGHR